LEDAKRDQPEGNVLSFKVGDLAYDNKILKLLMKDYSFRLSVIALVGTTIYSEVPDKLITQMIAKSSLFLAVSGTSFISIIKRFRKIDTEISSQQI